MVCVIIRNNSLFMWTDYIQDFLNVVILNLFFCYVDFKFFFKIMMFNQMFSIVWIKTFINETLSLLMDSLMETSVCLSDINIEQDPQQFVHTPYIFIIVFCFIIANIFSLTLPLIFCLNWPCWEPSHPHIDAKRIS